MALVLDRSGSMSGLPIDELRKEAERAAGALAKDDQLTIVAFDSQPTVAFPLAAVGDGKAVASAIARITPGGGTEGYSAIEAAYDQLRQVPVTHRHIVFLTDGKMRAKGIADLVARIADCAITVSTVALGGDTDRELLGTIATLGKGRFIEVAKPTKLAGKLAAEVRASKP